VLASARTYPLFAVEPLSVLTQIQMDAVLGFRTIRAVVADDLDDLVKQVGTLAPPRADDPGLEMRPIRRMAGEQQTLQPSDRRLVAERDSRRLGVKPPQHPAIFGCPKAPAEDVVEGVQIPPPRVVAKQPRNSRAKPSKSEKHAPSMTSTGMSSVELVMNPV
jgi:hypothetical protein